MGGDQDEEALDPRNFLNGMYSNDNFLKLKSQLENEIIEQTKQEVERKHMIKDADSYIADLNRWREERKVRDDQRNQKRLKEKEEEQEKFQEEIRKMEDYNNGIDDGADEEEDILNTDIDPELKKA